MGLAPCGSVGSVESAGLQSLESLRSAEFQILILFVQVLTQDQRNELIPLFTNKRR